MKKLSAVAFAFGLLSVSASQALAADATVNFSGTILQEACSVATSNNTVNVQLGTFGIAQFPTVGTTTLPVPFSINLTGCPASGGPTAALVTFSGAADAAGDLALTGGGSTGVSINIKKADGTNIDINSADSGIALTSAATQQLNFTANYISTSAAVTAGQANAVAQVNISYM